MNFNLSPLLLSIGAGACSLACADTIQPTFAWTDDGSFSNGQTYFSSGPSPTNYGYVPTTQGGGIGGSCYTDFGSACSSNYFAPGYTVDRTFTVTTPGLFVLSSSASASFETIGCYTLTCGAYFEPPIHTAGVSFSEVTSILGVFYQIVTGSGTGTAPADTLATANATGSGSDSVYLDVGNYTLEQSFSESVSGTGASWGSEGITFGLAAVPEPAGYPIVLGGGLLLALLLRGKFWLKYEE